MHLLGPFVSSDSWSIKFSIKDKNQEIVDLNGYKIILMIKRKLTDIDDDALISMEYVSSTSETEHIFQISKNDTGTGEGIFHACFKYIRPSTGKSSSFDTRIKVLKASITQNV